MAGQALLARSSAPLSSTQACKEGQGFPILRLRIRRPKGIEEKLLEAGQLSVPSKACVLLLDVVQPKDQ